ncbi:DUF724 domain-containing protein 2-like isoform X2 [Mangifera indica]|uniref:DUF724 domain-containing protein 2-like isoform X2 n=1 Tax=Mangifera indica TaxID=29780 RepID=UPI001CFAE719|nr:DUF724 domain-containing protein 2-like isoform X2 [Mangifera indica]
MVTSESEHPVIFTKGTEIEVTSDEDGFRGAWYRATLVESPPKSASKKRKKVLVEYKYLLADDGTSPLTEYVDPAYVRPLPPQKTTEKKPFELNDLVDANYRDGWWTGTVRKILDDGKLRVCFDNPPDVLDFEEKDLRLSWVWVNGNWVRPKKLQSTGSVFSPGTAVEVNPDELENLRDVWFPAIIIKENEDGTFFVKYENKMIGDEPGMVKVNLDSKHIRPTPPRYVDKNYELLEKVDTSYGFGWRAGVITKVLPEGRYNVFFKHGNVDKEFSHSELRPHLEWTDGKWISKSKEILIASGNQEQLGHACTSANNPEQALKFVSSSSAKDNSEDKTPNFTNIRNNQMKQSSPCHEDFTSYSFPSKKKIKLSDSNGSIMRSRPNRMLTERNVSETSSHIKEMPNETEDKQSDFMSKKAESTGTRRLKKPVMADQPPAKIESPYLGKRIKTKQQKFGADFQTIDLVKRKGRPTKFHVKMSPAAATGKETDTEVANAEELNENDRKEEEVETRVILGLKASKGVRGTQARNSVQISKNESLKLIRDQKKNINDSEGDNSTPRVGGSSQRRKRGRPRKLVITSPGAPEDGKDHKRAGVAADEIGVKDHVTSETELHTLRRVESAVSRDISGERVAQVSEIDSSIKEVDMAIAVVSNNPTDDDQPLSTWIGGMHSTSVEELRLSSGRTANGLNEARERQIDRVTESSANHNKNGTMPVENEVLPFVKKSTIWSTIESMEVFQIVPQNPHFQPLCETKEEYREGSAIGIMVTFAGLFEKISMLRLNDSRRIFDSTLESLVDLEKHGFDVTVLQDRVNSLLSLQVGQEENLNEIKETEKKVMEFTSENTKLDKELEEIKKKISELQEKLESTKLKKEIQAIEISRLQSHLDDMSERVQSAQHDFGKLATAPWKSA